MPKDPSSTTLQNVSMIPLRRVVNERGHLMEVQRRDDSHYPGFGQAYVTSTNPGVIKAWYRHSSQLDQIVLLTQSLHLVLYDTREHSNTRGHIQHIHLGESNPLLVQIPPGVWHGFRANGVEPSLLLHLNTAPFDFANPDEDRLAADDSTIPYSWPDISQ